MQRPLAARTAAALVVCLGLAAGARAAAADAAPAPAPLAPDGTAWGNDAATERPGLAVPQWDGLLARLAAEAPVLDACDAAPSACPTAAARDWLALLRDLRGRPRAEALRAVNDYVNARPYRTDASAYGRRDYWATPLEFLANSGDCEDYAIAKYVSLRRLGVPAGELRLVVVRDVGRGGVAHAVLAVAVAGGGWDVLDNLDDRIRPEAEAAAEYRPYYALSEASRWVFDRSVLPVAAGAAAARRE